ncbi:MAG: selenide, water dikinase SelD [Cyanobacteria bacterium P01_F01_bin.53]
MQPSVPIRKDLVMVGGGHSHALVLRKMGMQPWPADVRLTLITNLADTPYSGMLPCHISGLYDFDTAHIDLRPLTRFANCRLIMDEMIGLDPDNQKVICRHHPPIAYDTLSIDTGSTPTKSQVPGAANYAIPAKPVPNLLKAWDRYLKALQKQLIQKPQTVSTICIVGGGVGGVEMAFAMQVRLWKLMGLYGRNPQEQVSVHIFQRGAHLAKGRNRKTQRMVERMCAERGIAVHTGESVSQVGEGYVLCDSGLTVECDRTFWVTNAAAPPWLEGSGLALTHDGFITVEDTLQTLSHPNIFAAGDVATMANHKRPKAGVFAVRQGPPLYENLKRQVTGRSLKPFKPQRRYLNIIDTDTEKSIASWGPFAIHAKWCRAWKHSIDRKFMGLFSDFPPMSETNSSAKIDSGVTQPTHSDMHCSGCGSKVGEKVLTQALTRVRAEATENSQWPYRNNIIAGLKEPDDAAVVQVPTGKLAVHTVDHFSALVDDPFVFGQICVNHCLSDLFAMGATSHSALAITTIPYGTQAKQEESLYQLLSGATKALANSKTFLVGGHTTEGPELSLGFACNGWIDPQHLWRKGGLEPGQSLILTKAMGTGTLFAADQQLQAKGRWIEAAIDSMLHSNQAAAACLKQHGATACTDVTGFGLAGHLLEMVNASNVDSSNIVIDLDLSELALLPGADDTLSNNIVSSLHERNLNNAISSFQRDRLPNHLPIFQVLFDPQTSGGLLASIPTENTTTCLNALHQLGYTASCCIGSVKPLVKGSQPLTIKQW